MTYVYTLADPREPDRVRYVGVATEPRKRIAAHIAHAKSARGVAARARWICDLVGGGLRPRLVVVHHAQTREEAYRIERALIAEHRARGNDLLNCTAGGGGLQGWTHRPETKQKIAAATKHPKSAAARAHMGQATRALWCDPEWSAAQRQRLREKAQRQFSAPEAHAKASEAQRRRWSNPAEHEMAKAAARVRWRNQTPEQLSALRERRRAQWIGEHSPSRLAVKNPERNAKVSRTCRESWQRRKQAKESAA